MNKWRNINSAPKDGSNILLWDGHEVEKAAWRRPHSGGRKGWCLPDSDQDEQGGCAEVWNPTHWMPIPKPPIRKVCVKLI